LALSAASCSNSPSGAGGAQGNGSPGVTSDSITVGSIANLSGPLSSDFAPLVNGVEAYFSMVNAAGGVDGRRLVLADKSDDQGSSTTDLTVAQKLVEQDHVFAIVGVGTPFFGAASYLAGQKTPVFGYVVSNDWSDGPNLFGVDSSYLAFSTATMGYAYVATQLHASSVAVVAYDVPQSVRPPSPDSAASGSTWATRT
jgi:ABC-type branched-subunit amino acid transport system substrate-binding protein